MYALHFRAVQCRLQQFSAVQNGLERFDGGLNRSKPQVLHNRVAALCEACPGRMLAVRARPGRLRALSVLHSESPFYGVSVWKRQCLPARNGVFRPGQFLTRAAAVAPLVESLADDSTAVAAEVARALAALLAHAPDTIKDLMASGGLHQVGYDME